MGPLRAVLLAACSALSAAAPAWDLGLMQVELKGRARLPEEPSSDELEEPYEGGRVDGEPDTDVYAFEQQKPQESSMRHRRGVNVPQNGRVAIVIRGASFRAKQVKQFSCVGPALGRQTKATESLVEQVIKPFEQLGNKVDVIVTDRPCNMTEKLVDIIGQNRVKAFAQSDEGDQNRNILWALDTFVNSTGGKDKVEAKYDLILLVRHDTVWKKSMVDWPEADFSKVLFPYQCPTIGVHDLFTTMPGAFFHYYYNNIKWRQCFSGADGHLCLRAMVRLTNESSVGVAMHYGANISREPFDFWVTYGKTRQTC